MSQSPARCLATAIPPEILVDIIDLCREWDTSLWPEWMPDTWYYPLSYSFVCRYWREVILSFPHLWTIVDTPCTEDTLETTENAHNHVSLQVQRSGDFPLSIWLKDRKETKGPSSHPVMDALTPSHRKWKEVILDVSRDALEVFLASQTSWSFNELKSFKLALWPDWGTWAPLLLPLMFSGATNLTEVHLENYLIHSREFPWSQLTTLHLTRISEIDTSIYDILRQCPSLKDLFLDPSDFDEIRVVRDEEGEVLLPKLTHLTYGSTKIDYKADTTVETEGLLEGLRVPALEDLTIYGSTTALMDACSCIESSDSPPVVSLHVEEYKVLDAAEGFSFIMELIRLLPKLKTLSLSFCQEAPDDHPLAITQLDRLLLRLTESNSCTKLEDIGLSSARFSSKTAPWFIKALETRMASTATDQAQDGREVAKLHSLRISAMGQKGNLLENHFSDAQMSRIRELTAGMKMFELTGSRE